MTTSAVNDELQVARDASDAARASRPRGSQNRERLRSVAVDLAQRYGFATTSYRLRPNAEQVRRRVEAAQPSDVAAHVDGVAKPAFAELVVPADLVTAPDPQPTPHGHAPLSPYVIFARVERDDGARLSLELPPDPAHLDAVLAAFLRA